MIYAISAEYAKKYMQAYATQDNGGEKVINPAIDHLIELFNEDPRFAFVDTKSVSLNAPTDDDLADQDLETFAAKVGDAIKFSAGSANNSAPKREQLASDAIYTFLEHLTNTGIDITIDGRSVIENMAEIGDRGLQFVYPYVQMA